MFIKNQGDWIWTNDILFPKQVRYRAALHPVIAFLCFCYLEEERIMGIEPIWSAWKAENLPLIYIRIVSSFCFYKSFFVIICINGE